ncbi:MAG: hypothetical protein PIR02_05435 [Microbacterium enclense]
MDATTARTRPIDGKAIAAFMLGVGAALTSSWWPAAAVLAVAAISVALASRRALKADPQLRGVWLGLGGFLIAVVTLIVTFGPTLLAWFVFLLAPPG